MFAQPKGCLGFNHGKHRTHGNGNLTVAFFFIKMLDWSGGEGRAANALNWQTAWWELSAKA